MQPADRFGTLPPALFAGSDTLRAWASDPNDVYRVRASTGRVVEHFDGASWEVVLDERTWDVDGAAADDVWFATDNAAVHFDGHTLTRHPLSHDVSVNRLAALGAGAVAVAMTEQVWLYDGARWSLGYSAPPGARLMGIAGTGPGDVWAIRHEAGRTNDIALVHLTGATAVDVAADITGYGDVEIFDDRLWMSTDGGVSTLDGVALGLGWFSFDAALHVDDEYVWLTTGSEALRHPLP
jgi:hypothetical protein